jgi:transitional endoplasmic reticulum ATPase
MNTNSTNKLSLEVDKTYYIEEELIDKISLWMLRMLFRLGGHREFIDKDGQIKNDDIACFLDIGSYIDKDEFPRSEPIGILKNNHAKLERQNEFGTSMTLANNIAQISGLMNLNSTFAHRFQ